MSVDTEAADTKLAVESQRNQATTADPGRRNLSWSKADRHNGTPARLQ
jgi:hypothetical protein